jgi:AraC-like DNA-binding protein
MRANEMQNFGRIMPREREAVSICRHSGARLSYFNFNRCFRRRFGLTPSAARGR